MSFSQAPSSSKPIGLLKRGLGGTSSIQCEPTEFLSASFKGDKFHGQAKVSKMAPVNEVTSLSQVDVQQRIGKPTETFSA